MRLIDKALLGAVLLAFGTPWVMAADDASGLVKAADFYRQASDHLQVETQVNVLGSDGNSVKERRYTVFVQPKGRSLVLMRSPADQGQKLLMLGDDFWLMLPSSQRPIRITATQKLLGDASTGDIATMSWSDDYDAKLVGEEKCEQQDCLHLSLNATRKGVSYERIELWIGKQFKEPLAAELYVHSDKMAKRATFVVDKASRPTQVTEMVLIDKLSNNKETRVRYVSRQPKTVPETWWNPTFLVKAGNLE
jgi:hypothetical protein